MNIQINGKPQEISGPMNVVALLDLLKLPQAGLAVEINGEIVRKQHFAAREIREQDNVEIVHLIGGG